MAEGINLTENDIKQASSLRIFFGHQSVGYNIIDGMSDVTKAFNIIESVEIPEEEAFFLHSSIGENTKPETKINEFSEIISRIGGNCDAAFLKFCYIDISAGTDVEALFKSYKETIEDLKDIYPEIIFIHFTAPLTTIQTGPKAIVKRILGRSIGVDENIQRQRYNELLRNEYSGKDLVLDIAAIESTKLNGERVQNETAGYVYYSMFHEYTDDGGHLNKKGREIVAENLIKLLSNLK